MASAPSDLAERLLTLGVLSREQLQHALDEVTRTGRRLVPTIVALGYLDEEALAELLANQYRLPRVDLVQVSSKPGALAAVPREMCWRLRVVPLRLHGGVLVVAMDDPSDSAALDELRSVTKLEPAPVIAPVSAVEAALGN